MKDRITYLCFTKRVLVLLVVAAMTAVFCAACTGSNTDNGQSMPSDGPTNIYGNTAGNIANNGFVSKQGDWVYYNNTKGLYRVKTDGTEREQLSLDYAKGINVVGNCIYYQNTTNQGGGDGLWKLDLTEAEDTDTALLSLDTKASQYIFVVEDWIYYLVQSADQDAGIWRIKADCTNKEKIYYNPNTTISSINVQDDWIYFINTTTNKVDGIFKMKVDGTNVELLFEAFRESMPSSGAIDEMFVIDDWIYYYNSFVGIDDGPGFYRMKTDGSDRQLVFAVETSSNSLSNISENWIYYFAGTGDNKELHKVSLDGTEEVLVCNAAEIRNICIIDDWIYYLKERNPAGLYRMKLDGTDKQLVE